MPTTTEVEARLRRTARACEPIVEDLMGDRPAPASTQSPRRAGWLVAAALVAAAAAGGAVALNVDDGPTDEVRSSSPSTLFDRSTTTNPAAANPGVATPVTLPDGAEVVLAIPGPERWTARYPEVEVDLDGIDDPVQVQLTELGTAMAEPQVEERISERAWIGPWGASRMLFVEVDGWVATLHLASDGGDLPDEWVTDLARDLTFRVEAGGPVDVTAPGLTVVEARVGLVREADPFGREATLTAAHVPGGPHPICIGHPPVSDLSRTQRCVADDQILLSARGSTTQMVLPGIDGRLGAVDPESGQELPVSFADGTTGVLTIRPRDDRSWAVRSAEVSVAIDGAARVDGRGGSLAVQVFPDTAWDRAVATGSSLEEVADTVWLRVDGSGRRFLLVQGGGWTAEIPRDDEAQPVPDEIRDRLIDTLELEATAAGPGSLRASGLEVTSTLVVLTPGGAPIVGEDSLVLEVRTADGCADGADACLGDGRVRVAAGADAQAVVDDLSFEVAPRPR